MQFILITPKETLISLSRIVGAANIDLLLAENGLNREPKIGQQWAKKCNELIASTPNNVPATRKQALLNALTNNEEVFEKASLMDEDEWKVFSAFQAFRDALRLPETLQLPSSTRIIGSVIGNITEATIGTYSVGATRVISSGIVSPSDPVNATTYRAVMKDLQTQGSIDPGVFNTINTSKPVALEDSASSKIRRKAQQYSFNLPWGKIQMYSSLLDEVMDFPAYPEQVVTGREASYTSMPEIIYQYEPWIVYQSSGPRLQEISFHLHRDMWTGNHLDGRANSLIRFCEANTFPRYSGSSVLSPTVKFYIDGSLFVSGVMLNTNVEWTGPIGQDNWYLEFTLSLTIQEVSESKLNIDTVRKFGLIGT